MVVGKSMKGNAGGAIGGTTAGSITCVTVTYKGSVICTPDPDCRVTITLMRFAKPSTIACTA